VPVVVEHVGVPGSVVDLGGGGGGWLKAFKEMGTREVLCIEDLSIADEDLLILPEELLRCDLSIKMPEAVPCDLAVSIEVGEHLSRSRSAAIVDFLTACAPIVLFSAAVPRQGGHKHINEQWPAFWRALFVERGYMPVDAVRPRIIGDKMLPFWLRQNVGLYVRRDSMTGVAQPPAPYRCIPDDFELISTNILHRPHGLRELLREMPGALRRALKKRLWNA
jgi:hypothetical protein